MANGETKQKILQAAARVFSERGFAGTSLRSVTSEAGVNLAAVHYHFGTKEDLLRAVFSRRIEPVNEKRIAALDRLEAASGAVEVEDILEAFLAPIIELKRDLEGEGLVWSRFLGRVYSEPSDVVEALIRDQFAEVGRRFVSALHRSMPHLGEAEVFERLQFAIGMMTHTLTDLHLIRLPGIESRDRSGAADTLRHMIVFLSAAFRAPAAEREPLGVVTTEARAS